MVPEPKPFTFLQVSDVHLDSAFGSRKINLPSAKRRERQEEMLSAFARVFEMAQQRRVDAIVIPGDLWDAESVSSKTVNRVIELCMSVPETFIVIAPGNHDYYSADSMYSLEALSARGMRSWPDNVHIFTASDFSPVYHPTRSDVCFVGRAFVANVEISERLLADKIARDNNALNILLFHGSLDTYQGADSKFPGKLTAPFSADELARQGFAYAAVGHYHHLSEIKSQEGRLIGAYSGCLVGRGLDETGPRYCLFGTASVKEDGQVDVKLEPVELDKRRIVVCELDISGKTSGEVVTQVSANFKAQGAREGKDIVYLQLCGRYPTGGEPTYVEEKLAGNYFHLELDDCTRPDYKIDSVDERTTEGKFILFLTTLKKQAQAAGGTLMENEMGQPLDLKTIDDALYFGLDALKQKRVTIRNVD